MITYQNKQSITLIFDKYWNGELKIEIKRNKTKKKDLFNQNKNMIA